MKRFTRSVLRKSALSGAMVVGAAALTAAGAGAFTAVQAPNPVTPGNSATVILTAGAGNNWIDANPVQFSYFLPAGGTATTNATLSSCPTGPGSCSVMTFSIPVAAGAAAGTYAWTLVDDGSGSGWELDPNLLTTTEPLGNYTVAIAAGVPLANPKVVLGAGLVAAVTAAGVGLRRKRQGLDAVSAP